MGKKYLITQNTNYLKSNIMETKNFNQTMSNEPTLNEKVMLPRPRMGFKQAVSTCFGKYATFKGRARRSEYWWFTLFTLIAFVVLFGPAMLLSYLNESCGINIDGGPWLVGTIISAVLAMAGILFCLFIIIPSISVEVRRLHDTGRSGWWLFWSVVVVIVATSVPFFVLGSKAFGMEEIQTITEAFKLALLPGLLVAVPIVAEWLLSIITFVFTLLNSHKEENKYGLSPKYQ